MFIDAMPEGMLVVDPISSGPTARVTALEPSPLLRDGVIVRRPTATTIVRGVAQIVAEMVRESRAELLRQFEQGDGAWRMDIARDRLLVSQSAGARIGIEPAISDTLDAMVQRVHPAHQERFVAAITRSALRGLPLDVTVRLRGAPGRPNVPVRFRACLVEERGRRLVGTVSLGA